MRYAGQNYEHLVPVSAEPITEEGLRAAFDTFETIHAERYGYRIEGEEIELVAFHVTVTGRRPSPPLVATAVEGESAVTATRPVHFRGSGKLPASIYRRYGLPAGTRLEGPAILEEFGSTTLIEPDMTVEVLPDGQLLIETGVA
jgi:N-methylhydantoinase A/oxoprolinase/acetone carboxylase beta subunit